jgi:hypothetical protein
LNINLYHIQITTKIADKETSKIIKDESIKAALKSVFNNRSPHAVLKNFCKADNYKAAMIQLCSKELEKEIDQIVSRKGKLLKTKDCESLMDFNWVFVEKVLKQEAPKLYMIFSNLINLEKKENLPVLITSLAVLLYGRSRTVSQLQHILGLTMDKCGLTKEVN